EIEINNLKSMFNFIKRQPPEKIPNYLNSSDAAFLSFADNDLFNMTIPAKLQSYLACGIPIVASAGGESKYILEESKAGYCTETGDSKQLAESIIEMMKLSKDERKLMGKRAREYYEDNFDKDYLLNKMDGYFN